MNVAESVSATDLSFSSALRVLSLRYLKVADFLLKGLCVALWHSDLATNSSLFSIMVLVRDS